MFFLKEKTVYFRGLLYPLIFLTLSFFFCLPFFKDLYSSGSGDWDYFMFLYEVPSMTLFDYRQFPLWNPYCGGGIITDRQSPGRLSFSDISFDFDLRRRRRFENRSMAAHVPRAVGDVAPQWLSGINGPARLAPSFIFMFSGAWALHIAAGHIVWLPAALLPFFFLTFLKGLENRWWLLAAAMMESVMFYEGGTYVFAFSLLFVFVYVVVYSIEKRSLQPLLGISHCQCNCRGLVSPQAAARDRTPAEPPPPDRGWQQFAIGYLLLLFY